MEDDNVPGLGFPIDACKGELTRNPRQCIQKARKGSRQHMVTICYSMDSISKDLKVDAVAAIMPFIKYADNINALADAIVFAVSTLKWDLYTDNSNIATALQDCLLCFWDPLVRTLRRRYERCFGEALFTRENEASGLNTISLAIYSSLLLGIGRNVTLGPKFYANREMTRLPIRMWLHAMAASSPGHCLVEVQECFWACFTAKGVEAQAFVETLVEEAGGDARKVAHLSVSELRGNTRDKSRRIKEMLNLQIRFNMILLLSLERKVHFAALESGAIPAITKAALRLRKMREACCTASSEVLFLNTAETILERADTVRGITEAVEAGMLKVLAESVAFAKCTCLRKYDVGRMSSLLKSFLTRHLVLDSVLDVVVTEMAEMNAVTLIELKRSPFAEAWGTLRATALERAVLKIMLENEDREHGRVALCDFCWRSSHILDLKKCAGCKTSMYCSAECQRRDWKECGHKEECKGSSDRAQPPLKPNDKHFLARLAECDIRRHISDLDAGTALDYEGVPDDELYYAVNYAVNPMTLDVYNLVDLDESTPATTLNPQKREVLLERGGAGRMKLVEVTYPLGDTKGRFLHVVDGEALRRTPVVKPVVTEDVGTMVKGVPEAWFRSKAVWAIPPTVQSDSEEEEEGDEDEETEDENEDETDEDDPDSDAEGPVEDDADDASNKDDEDTPSDSESGDANAEDSSSEPDTDKGSDSDDSHSTTPKSSTPSTSSTKVPIQSIKDEVNAILGYMLSACGLACDQKSYERLVSVKYSWQDLEKMVEMCRSSETWPFESDERKTVQQLKIKAP